MAEYIFEIQDALYDEETGHLCIKPKCIGEIIRCKDCLYFENGKDYTPYCNRVDSALTDVEQDDFCSRAERKDNG